MGHRDGVGQASIINAKPVVLGTNQYIADSQILHRVVSPVMPVAHLLGF